MNNFLAFGIIIVICSNLFTHFQNFTNLFVLKLNIIHFHNILKMVSSGFKKATAI